MQVLIKIIWVFSLLIFTAFGAADVEAIIKSNVKSMTTAESLVIILTKSDVPKVKALAKMAFKRKVYRGYKVKQASKTIGFGILITRKVRSKKATVLYYFDTKDTLLFTEILAFSEPPEYKPNKQWMSQFKNKKSKSALKVGMDIPTISGATLTARNVTDGARLARALIEVKLK